MPPALLSQESTVVTELVVTEATVASVLSLSPVASAVMAELTVAEVSAAPPAIESYTPAFTRRDAARSRIP
ncbi:hypothetical protein Pyn_39214 [Prunus yedoensis var. nudiflora]|uniref:Uncharacterized protein n=1 Tax=Prunus yedoensis var. nudiflora TaxID=2094558 RepID=A0A314ULC5_PRUYE|nr:hypothetical protein Pyn_39214 [Prunus yedoensis var. nudiflora]